jgi:hypothetical protein
MMAALILGILLREGAQKTGIYDPKEFPEIYRMKGKYRLQRMLPKEPVQGRI